MSEMVALITGSAEETALLAANLGGDSDSVASIGGAIAGALNPASVNDGWFEVVNTINGDHLLEAATSLAARRRGCKGAEERGRYGARRPASVRCMRGVVVITSDSDKYIRKRGHDG